MKPLNFIIIKLAAYLMLGIVLTHGFNLLIHYTLGISAAVFMLLSISFFIARQQFQKTIWFGLLAWMMMCCLGSMVYHLHNQKNIPQHYTNLEQISDGSIFSMTFKVKERLKASRFHDKYIVDLIHINQKPTTGNLLLNVEKDSLKVPYKIDDVILVRSEIQALSKPLNPHQFNYKAYLEKQYIYHQIVTKPLEVLTMQSKRHTVFGYAEALRQTINNTLKQHQFQAEELAIINALLLGQRQDMDQGIYENYSNAGAIHILAVSGLHVGIILLMLSFILKPIEHLKYGKGFKVFIIIILLWGFAIVAGLSASVTRAVTMFSIVAIAMHLKRVTHIYNTLACSIFILLLFKPMFLFDVGFQMSYLAVIAIVSIQPLVYKLWKPRWTVLDYFWQMFTVTFAAQIGVAPISLYYFHQFPSLFFVSNLAIIPFLGLILGLGILIIILALLNSLPYILAHSYITIIKMMNGVVIWVSKQEAFLFENISFDYPHVIVSYSLIIATLFLCKNVNYKNITMFLIAILLVQGTFIYYDYKNSKATFIIFHKSRNSIIGIQSHSKLKIYNNLDVTTSKEENSITNFAVGNFIDSIESNQMTSVYKFRNNIILVVDSLGIYNVKDFKPDYILLCNSPRMHLERLIDSIHPKYIIADGSNYKSYVKRWEISCRKRKLPFHYTGEKGAFILN